MPSSFPQSSCLLEHYNGGDKASYRTETLNGRGGHSCVCIVSPSARSPPYASRSMGEGETRTDVEASRTHSQGNRGGGGIHPALQLCKRRTYCTVRRQGGRGMSPSM